MPQFPLNTDDLLGCREVRFMSRQETNYPILMRLTLDFDLRVLQLQRRTYSHISLRYVPASPEFILGNADYREQLIALSPGHASLKELEAYAQQHQVDILHDYLFGLDRDQSQG